MGLQPLEFTECLTDSPYFREKLHSHEKELENTSQAIKGLIKDVKDLLSAAKSLSRAQRNFASNMISFKFECIGTSQTDDELTIAGSLKEFGHLIHGIEDERDRMLDRAYDQFIKPMETFRKDHLGEAKEGKKKFNKETTKFCQSLEKHVNLTTKKNESTLQEADAGILMEQRAFQQAYLQYVFLLQKVQERKKFEFVETILGFMYGWLTFYHQGHEVAKDFKPFMTDLQLKLQKTRENFLSTQSETETLMHKMLEVRKTKSQDCGSLNKMYTRQGYLFLMEKKAFGTTWSKHYCSYQKKNKCFSMVAYNQTVGKPAAPEESFTMKSCVRRSTDSIEKRFCFDIIADDRPAILTFQALTEEDQRLWLDALDGKEPNYSSPVNKLMKADETVLDDTGFAFVKKAISVLEERGLEDQGLYRIVGVTTKVNKLISMGLDRRKLEKLNFDDPLEWENKTITSALKIYFRNLPEPLMTFKLHGDFIQAAKLENQSLRINSIHQLLQKLPKINLEMLDILVKHLFIVAANSSKNLMPVSNLGVCFGPTLLRPEEETVAAIMDIKFVNVVIEILIENYEKIFKSTPDQNNSFDEVNTKPVSALTVAPAKPLLRSSFNSDVYQPPNMVNSSYRVDESAKVNTVGIPSSTGFSHASPTPVPPARHKNVLQKPLVVYNPAGPDSSSLLSNHNSSSESLISRSSRDCNNHSSSSSSPQTNIKQGLTNPANSRPEQLNPASFLKKRQSLDSVMPLPKSPQPAPSIKSLTMDLPSKRRVRTLYHCDGDNETELSFVPNQIITNVHASREPGWLEGTLNGKFGLIPENYVEYLP